MANEKKHKPTERIEREDREVTIAGRTITWSKDWDDPEDYEIDMERSELDGFHIGERVEAVDEIMDALGYCIAEEGMQGVIIGVTKPHPGGGMFNTPPRSAQLLVGWDDMDPGAVDAINLQGA